MKVKGMVCVVKVTWAPAVCAHARVCVRVCGVCDGCTVMRDEGRNIGSTGERWLAASGDNNTNSN